MRIKLIEGYAGFIPIYDYCDLTIQNFTTSHRYYITIEIIANIHRDVDIRSSGAFIDIMQLHDIVYMCLNKHTKGIKILDKINIYPLDSTQGYNELFGGTIFYKTYRIDNDNIDLLTKYIINFWDYNNLQQVYNIKILTTNNKNEPSLGIQYYKPILKGKNNE